VKATGPSLRQRVFARILASHRETLVQLYQEKKEALIAPLRGRILEIGPGTGINLRHFHPDATWVGIEPNTALHPFVYREAAALNRQITLHGATLDDAPIKEASMDAVVSTLVLCSVPEVATTLQQIWRVLRPGGKYVYLEHVADRPGTLRRVAQKVAPWSPYRFFSDGCHPGRDIAADIAAAGFTGHEHEAYMQQGPLLLALSKPHIAGIAAKP